MPMFQVFHLLHMFVSNVLSGRFKSRSWSCTCCKATPACFIMFQVFHMFQTTYVVSGCFKSRSWCCTCCNGYIRMFYAHVSSVSSVFIFYVTNVSSRCFKSRSGVACRRPVAAASASPWFTCRSLRPTDASAARICRRGRWCGSQFHRAGVGRVPPCRCWMGRGCVVSTVRCAGFARATVSNAGTGREQDRTCGMHA